MVGGTNRELFVQNASVQQDALHDAPDTIGPASRMVQLLVTMCPPPPPSPQCWYGTCPSRASRA